MLTSTGMIEKLGQSAGSWATLTCLVSLLLAINLHVICIYSNTTKYMQKVVTLYIVCVYQCVIPANTHTHIRTLIHPWVITTTKIPSLITVSPVGITAFKVSYSPPPPRCSGIEWCSVRRGGESNSRGLPQLLRGGE